MVGKIIIWINVWVFILYGPMYGMEADSRDTTPYILQRINGEVKLDGLSDEAAWQGIRPFPVVMHIPEFGKEPTERTEIMVAYDDNYLYMAGLFYDSEPGKIQSLSKKRDDLGTGNDWFVVLIDTFNDKENALGFYTNPAGLRTDLAVFNDAQGDFPVNLSWNTFWDAAAVRNNQGWFAEMRIPFSSLRFQDKDGKVVMGLTTWRWIPRKNELIIFPAKSPERGALAPYKSSLAQEVVLTGIKSRKPFYIYPYILGGLSRSFEMNDLGTSYQPIDDNEFEAGLDIKYGLTNNLTMDITVNTDFAQVEADDEQVNLTRFSLFFPEKRLFFQERSSIFDFNFGEQNQLFYSRRIGIYDGKPVRIYGGIRLVGRMGSWDLGLINMQTAEVEDLSSENFGVFRVRRQVFNRNSYVGGMVTSRLGMDGTYNIAYGLDGIFRLFGYDYLTINWAQSFEMDGKNRLFSIDSSRIWLNWERRHIKGMLYNLSYSRSGADYNPGMGFEFRDDFTRFGEKIGYGWVPGEKSKLLSHSITLNGFIFIANQDHAIESSEIGPVYELSTKSGYVGQIGFKRFYENVLEGFWFTNEDDGGDRPDVPAGQYTFYGLDAAVTTPEGYRLFMQTKLYGGTFYDGWRFSFEFSPRWSISSGLELSGTYQYNRIGFADRDKNLDIHILRLRILTMLSTKFSGTAFIQYNSALDAVTANLRLRYNPREGTDLYLVYNEGLNTDRSREIPPLPRTNNRTIMLKYIHAFNFKL